MLGYGISAPSATFLGPSLSRGKYLPGGPREVALTFDDGPSVPYTGQVLDILRKNHIHATFFICGANAELHPELVRRIEAEGHEIGNHTYSHPWLYLMERRKIADEIDHTQDVLQRISGRRPRLFRPPFGIRWFSLWPLLQERGLTMVMWSMRGYDGDLGAAAIAQTTLKQLVPGGIILLHDGFETHKPAEVDRSATVRALPAIIDGIQRAGYKFVLIPRLVTESFPFQAVVFLGSFLTFSLELTVAKMLLPRFGGSAYVWTTCVMFFQALLLAGYGWGHAALGRLGARKYSRVHLLLLLAPLPFFPLRLAAPLPGAGPLLDLTWTLLRACGAPFFVLSTTILVVQGWLMNSELAERRDAYFLFAASNLGALAGLFAYPFLIEPLLTLKSQSFLWLGLYAIYAVLHLACLPRAFSAVPAAEEAVPVSGRERALWLLLSAAPCAAMLATTNLLTFDFAAVPLLWTAPLAVYLVTFVLNFKRAPWYPGRLNSGLLPVLGLWVAACLAAAALAVSRSADSGPVQTLRRLIDIGKFGYVTAALFVVGMICHKSLAASRPRGEKPMTEFYSWVAAGGLLGSLSIGVLVPWLGRSVAVLSLDWLAAGAVAAAALALRDWDALTDFARRRKLLAAGATACLLAVGALVFEASAPPDGVVRALRNFYGVYRVVDKNGTREFFHGNTDHGMQSLDPAKAGVPLTYYNVHSPLAEAYGALGKDWREVAVVGLGAGAIAAYGRAGQTMDFYELDPDVAMIAQTDFTYLKTSPARIRIILGDARRSLALDEGASYDLLILDAFNSGAVPIHLVTKEALELYLTRIPRDGVILLHVSNRYLDMRSMLAALARDLSLSGACKRLTQNGRVADDRVPSSWVALSRDPGKMKILVSGQGWTDLRDPAFARGEAWTDQHASLLPVLAL